MLSFKSRDLSVKAMGRRARVFLSVTTGSPPLGLQKCAAGATIRQGGDLANLKPPACVSRVTSLQQGPRERSSKMSTPVFPVDHKAENRSNRFTPEEVEHFERDGFAIARGIVEEPLCRAMLAVAEDGLRREIQPIEYEADLQYPGAPESYAVEGGRTARRLRHAHSRNIVFTDWLTRPALVERMRQLLGRELVVPLAHHNCIMTKAPRFSSETGWHQDIRYWSFRRPELVSVWLALGPENIENGCLRMLPGTHRLCIDRRFFDEAEFLRADLPESQELIESHVCGQLDPGDVLFFHCRTLHSATRNYSHRPKYSVVFTFRALDNPPIAGTRSASVPEMLIPPPD